MAKKNESKPVKFIDKFISVEKDFISKKSLEFSNKIDELLIEALEIKGVKFEIKEEAMSFIGHNITGSDLIGTVYYFYKSEPILSTKIKSKISYEESSKEHKGVIKLTYKFY